MAVKMTVDSEGIYNDISAVSDKDVMFKTQRP